MWAKYKKQSGFTIVELLIVIVVIAILAAISIVAYNGIQNRAKFSKISQDLKSMQKLIEIYKADNGIYPITPTNNWLRSYQNQDDFIPGIVPTYAPSLPRFTAATATNSQSYLYRSNIAGTEYKLIRLGQPIPADEQGLVPDTMKDQYWATNADRYGYWSSGGSGF